MKNRKETTTGAFAVGMVAAFAVAASAAQLQLGAVQQMHSGPTWQFDAPIAYAPEGATAIKVTFNEGQVPSGGAMRAAVLVDRDIPDSPFFGDYIANGINTLQLNIVSHEGNAPAMARWHLRAGAGDRNWYCNFPVEAVAGTVQTRGVPLTLSAGWWTPGGGADLAGMFAADLQSVTYVAVQMTPGQPVGMVYTPKQSYTLDGVVVINDSGISSPPGSLTPLQRGLIARFGYGYGSVDALTEEMRQFDTDNDGMADYVEIWAENDQVYANSIFAAEIVEVATAGVTIKWAAVAGEVYTVLRSGALPGAFLPVPGLNSLTAEETGFKVHVDPSAASGEGPFYYRILRHE